MLYKTQFEPGCPLNYRLPSVSLSQDLQAVEIGYNRTPCGLRQIMKREVYILHYITKGCGTFCGEPFAVGQGYLVVPNDLETVEADGNDPYEAYWIMFRGEQAATLLEVCGLPHRNMVFDWGQSAECARILHRVLFDREPQNEWEEAAVMNEALYRLLSMHFGAAGERNFGGDIARKAKKLMRENYAHSTVESVAESLGYSRHHLCALFKEAYGTTPQAYLLNLRIRKAQELLTSEHTLTVREVAQAVGYADALYFSRVFRKKVGVPPKEFAGFNR